jgi:hypothetical protein
MRRGLLLLALVASSAAAFNITPGIPRLYYPTTSPAVLLYVHEWTPENKEQCWMMVPGDIVPLPCLLTERFPRV